jgi:hypothetical protein
VPIGVFGCALVVAPITGDRAFLTSVFTGGQVGLIVLFGGEDLPDGVGAIGSALFDRTYEARLSRLDLGRF